MCVSILLSCANTIWHLSVSRAMREMLTFTLTHQAGINAELSELSLSSDSCHDNRVSESVNQHSEALFKAWCYVSNYIFSIRRGDSCWRSSSESSGFKLPLFEGVLNGSDTDFTVVKTLSRFTRMLFWLKIVNDIWPLKDKFEDILYCLNTKLYIQHINLEMSVLTSTRVSVLPLGLKSWCANTAAIWKSECRRHRYVKST